MCCRSLGRLRQHGVRTSILGGEAGQYVGAIAGSIVGAIAGALLGGHGRVTGMRYISARLTEGRVKLTKCY